MTPRLRPFGPLLFLLTLVLLTGREGMVTAQPKAAPITVPPQSPTLNVPFPLGVQRGQTIELTLTGTNLADPTALWTSFPAKATILPEMAKSKDAATRVRIKLEVPVDASIGFHSIRVATKQGISNARIFCVDELPQMDEAADNTSREKAQAVPVPGVVVGKTTAESSDYYKVAVKPGQRITFDVLGRRLGSLLDPMIRLFDAKTGREMPGHYSDDEPGLQSDARLTRTFPSGADLIVEVRDTRHLGGADYYYRLRIADTPAAMTAFPVAIQRGTKSSVSFSGRHVEGVAPIEVAMPADRAAVQVAPKGQGPAGWPVPVYASDMQERVEQEPNNELAKANRLNLPCGVSARFLDRGDTDHFVFSAKKGVKYSIVAESYAILSPAEVYLIVKDAKGAELAKSNPQNTPAKVDFTAPADGDFTIYAEHLNYLSGPTEVYHLSVKETAPDFDVQLQLDRVALAPGETTLIPVAPAVRRDFTGPIELTVTGHPGFSGTVSVPNVPPPPANQPAPPAALLPVTCKGDVPLGAYDLRVVARANINGKEVTKLATVTDAVKAGLSNLSFPPPEMLSSVAVAVTDKPLFSLVVKMPSPDAIRGVAANVTVTATRSAGFADEIQLTSVGLPANVTAAVKPIPKGANEISFPLTPAANAPLGPIAVTFRATAKSAGKDVAYLAAPARITIGLPAEIKAEPSPLTLRIGQKAKLKVSITRKGDYKGPVDVELKNLPANVTAPKVTAAPDKTSVEIELTAAANAAAADKPDVQAVGTATAAGNQQATSPNILLKVVK